jgi:radical SAM protein with 4Fe4S-binding SPASM domain
VRDQERTREAARRRLNVVKADSHPAYVVWELTLKCDHACHHCGSRAIKARPSELTTAEALKVVKQLTAMKTRELVLIGGEAYLHEGFLDIVQAVSDAGITPVMTTGGMGITPDLAQDMARAGMKRVSVSIDGLQSIHDTMRNRAGSFEQATKALTHLARAGIDVSANTNFNRSNVEDLEALYEHLRQNDVRSWQIQITAALGRAADRPHMLFQPFDLLDFVPRVAELKKKGLKEGMLIMPGNNLGYFGPEEALLRSQKEHDHDHFMGCQAGRFVMGIESDGAVKGCPSLQTSHYVGGNLRETPLQSIWNDTEQLAFTRQRTVEDLWGFCRKCSFNDVCMGGCSFTAHALFGRPGNNPYCHFRARSLAQEGKRERVVLKQQASGLPFDHGLFELVVEAIDAKDETPAPSYEALVQLPSKVSK